MKSKATSFDIAYQAGVSQSTVSRALSGSSLVSDQTRQKIQAIAKELNYKVDKNASNLRTQSSNTIALLLFEDPSSDDSNINPFFLSMLGSITRACATANYDLLVSFQQMSDDWHADFEDCHKADGIILLGYGDYCAYEEKLIKLIEQDTNFILWGAPVNDLDAVSVSCDNHQGGFDITKHLLDLGHKKFAFIGQASPESPEFLQRYQGHCQALNEAGIDTRHTYQLDADFTESSGYLATLELLKNKLDVDAIVTASDLIAIGVIKALEEQGVAVPDKIAVVGFDDISIAQFTHPPLTTIRQDTNLAGKLLVDNLVSLIGNTEISSHVMPAKVVIRKSCGS